MTPILQAIPPRVRLHPALFDRLAFAVIAEEAGQPEAVQWALDRLADDFGRVAVSLAEQTRRRRQERERALRNRPVSESPTPEEMSLLRRRDRQLDEARRRGDAKARKEAAEARFKAVQGYHDRLERRANANRITEITALEAARGGAVVVERVTTEVPELDSEGKEQWKKGQRVMKSVYADRATIINRDGLYTLATPVFSKAGKMIRPPAINAIEYAAGVRYQGMTEKVDPTKALTPAEPGQCGGGGKAGKVFDEDRGRVANWAPIRRAQSQAKAAEELAKVDAWVREHAGEDALRVLRAVAGGGATIYRLSDNGSRRKAIRLTKALIRALGVVADYFGLH